MADGANDRLYRALGRLVFAILQRESVEVQMSAFTDALAAMLDRVAADFAHMQDLLNQALATDVADQATIAQLQADAAATAQSVTDAIAAVNAVDPDPSFPAPPTN